MRALTRALNLLEAVASHSSGVNLSDLSEQVDLAPSTAHRLLKGLEARRYINQDEERGLWFIGVNAFTVGAVFLHSRNIVSISRSSMRILMEKTQETVNLALRDDLEAIYISQVECRQIMRSLSTIGARTPLHASGVGKALLTGLPPRRCHRVLQRLDYTPITESTLTRLEDLEANIAQSRIRGYAVDDEEHAIGLRCAATPIYNEHGEVIAALSVSGPKARINDQRLSELGELVSSSANQITLEMGGQIK